MGEERKKKRRRKEEEEGIERKKKDEEEAEAGTWTKIRKAGCHGSEEGHQRSL